MSTPVDDLHVKQWIAIVGEKDEPEESPSQFNPFAGYERKSQFDGRPLQIIAISLPYLCVQSGGHRFSLDIRRYSVKLLHRKYVRAMDPRHFDPETSSVRVADIEPDTQAKSEGGQGCCPMCGDRLIERRIDNGIWVHACRECGFTGGRPPEQEIGE